MPTLVEPFAESESLAHSALFQALKSGFLVIRKMHASLTEPPRINRQFSRHLADTVAYCLTLPDLISRLCESISQGVEAGEIDNLNLAGGDVRTLFESCGEIFDSVGKITEGAAAQGFPIEGADELVEAHRQIEDVRRGLLEAHPGLDVPPSPSGLSPQGLREAAERNPPPPEWFAENADLTG
jgi:hypothetical protein